MAEYRSLLEQEDDEDSGPAPTRVSRSSRTMTATTASISTFADVSTDVKRSILDDKAAARSLKVQWESFEQPKFITAAEAQLLTQFLAADSGPRDKILKDATKGPAVLYTVLVLIHKVTKDDTLRVLLTLLDDLLEEEPTRAQLITAAATRGGVAAWKPLIGLLDITKDKLVAHLTARVLSRVVTVGDANLPAPELLRLFKWVNDCFLAEHFDSTELALIPLMRLLRFAPYRAPFFAYEFGVEMLRALLLLDVARIQIHYRAVYCLWVLTFDKAAASTLDKGGSHIIGDLCNLARTTKKEKVVRVALATLRNLVQNADKDAALKSTAAMVTFKLLPTVQLGQSKFSDEDVQEDATFLEKQLSECCEHMSSFEEYRNELLSGQLEWSPVHRLEKFWRDNAARLNDDNHKLVKTLVELLDKAKDPVVLAVAAHDIGEYVHYYPHGRTLVERLNGKALIMNYLGHDDEAVRYEALICVQKLMTQNWGLMNMQVQQAAKTK